MTETTALESDAFVFLGATGDLASRRIFPALQTLIRRGGVNMPIIGVAKSATDVDGLRARAHDFAIPPDLFPTVAEGLARSDSREHDP